MRLCDRIDCKNIAKWYPVLLIFAPTGDNPARSVLPLAVCAEHKATATLADYMTDENWEQLANAFVQNGYVRPQRARTQLAWQAIAELN